MGDLYNRFYAQHLATAVRAVGGTQAVVDLVTRYLHRPSTQLSQGSELKRFHRYLNEYNLPFHLPVRPGTLMNYIAYLYESNCISGVSLSHYLTPISTLHQRLDLPNPVVDPLVVAVKRAYVNLDSETEEPESVRGGIPAQVMRKIFDHGLASPPSALRDVALLCFMYLFGAREYSALHLKLEHVEFDTARSVLRVRFPVKMRARNRLHALEYPLSRTTRRSKVYPLTVLESWHAFRSQCSGVYYFSPNDIPLSAGYASTALTTLLQLLHIPHPSGVVYSSHSLRRGAATAMHLLQFDDAFRLYWFGWKRADMIQLYTDPSLVLHGDVARAEWFFGVLQPHSR
jgi:integrase